MRSRDLFPEAASEELFAELIAPGAFRAWHVADAPGRAFHVAVSSPAQARRVLDLLAAYDAAQRGRGIEDAYHGTQGLEVYGPDGWVEWLDSQGRRIDQAPPESLPDIEPVRRREGAAS